jgi:hypothetical protein
VTEFDFDAARRWARFDPERTLARRGDDELLFANASLIGGQALLLDTCVYIDQMQNRSPQARPVTRSILPAFMTSLQADLSQEV